MRDIRSFISVIVIISVFAVCALCAYASVFTSTYAVWNAKETAAYARTDSYTLSDTDYWIDADITSNTGDHSYAYKYCTQTGNDTVATSWVPVVYGAGLPLISVNGGSWSN